MKTVTISSKQRYAACALLLVLTASAGVFAQEHGRGGPSAHEGLAHVELAGSEHEHLDTRFSHNQTYLNRGYSVHDAPRGGYAINLANGQYWYDSGQWYLNGNLGWTVVDAPFGAFVSVLPPFHTTLTVDGVPYYYANDTYYTWKSDQGGYEVIEPPVGSNRRVRTNCCSATPYSPLRGTRIQATCVNCGSGDRPEFRSRE
jgi:hypothetical protein